MSMSVVGFMFEADSEGMATLVNAMRGSREQIRNPAVQCFVTAKALRNILPCRTRVTIPLPRILAIINTVDSEEIETELNAFDVRSKDLEECNKKHMARCWRRARR